MALLFVESFFLLKKNTMLKTVFKALELLFLSVGLLSTLPMVKGAAVAVVIRTRGINMNVVSTLVGFWNSLVCVLSSPLSIYILINSMVALIFASSTLFRHDHDPPEPQNTNHRPANQYDDDDDTIFSTHYVHDDPTADMPPPVAPESPQPPPAPPPSETLSLSLSLSTGQQRYHDDDASGGRRGGGGDSPQIMKDRSSSSTEVDDEPNRSGKVNPSNSRSSPVLPEAEAEACTCDEMKKREAWSLAIYSQYPSSPSSDQKLILESTDDESDHHSQPFPEAKEALIQQRNNENEEAPAASVSPHSDEDDLNRGETIESTWKAISGGGEKKQFKKSKTWDAPTARARGRASAAASVCRLDSEEVLPSSPKWRELKKAFNFNDAVSIQRRGGLIRNDPSVSIQDFNRQVENFIKRCNEDMRLQRQESDQRRLLNLTEGRRRQTAI